MAAKPNEQNDNHSTQAGVWIDHKEAFIVFTPHETDASPQGAASGSDDAENVRFTGAHRGEGHGAEDQRDAQFYAHLDGYYDDVIARLADATHILLLGPGEAKGELRKRIDALPLAVQRGGTTESRVLDVQSAEHMTPPQLRARVEAFYEGFARGLAPGHEAPHGKH